jgi:ectoine hydroxylase-related dioxygenase (phytanoyl-CoA dioxygenase family)
MMSGMNSAPYLELTIKKNTKYNSGGAIMNYNEGDVLFWQSHLIHGYSGNNSDNRISISFNIMPKHFYNNSYSFKVVRE